MSDAKTAWDEVGDRFADLGKHIKDRYEARVAFAEEDKAKLDDAMKKLGDALETAFGALGDTMRDPDIRVQLKDTAGAMGTALTTTFRELADVIDEKLRAKKDEE